MDINVNSHHIEVTDAMRTHINQKLAKLERHFNHIISIDITFIVEKQLQIVEGKIKVPQQELFAKSESDDMYNAVDSLLSKLDKQLIKFKEKLRS